MTPHEFKKKLKNLEPGRELVYYAGNDLAYARSVNEDTNLIAALAFAVADLDYGVCFQRKIGSGYEYVLRVFRKLGIRNDGNGAYQEVVRCAALHTGRIREHGSI
jgi:hypothetical protein